MYINLYDVFRGRWDGWKEAVQMIDDMIEGTEIDHELMTLKEVKERAQYEVEMARHSFDDWRDKRSVDPFAVRRRKHYGRMHGCEEALDFVRSLPESDKRDWTLRRMEYHFDKEIQIKPTFHKGVHGKKYDSYACGNCGYGGVKRHEHYCPNCGFALGWEVMYEPDEESGEVDEQGIDADEDGEGTQTETERTEHHGVSEDDANEAGRSEVDYEQASLFDLC